MTEQIQPNQPTTRHWGAFWFGLILGWGIGAVYGIARAPRSGEETRARIAEQGSEIALKVQEQLERDPVEEAIEEGKAVAQARQAGRGSDNAEAS
jgi:gas vesicle protein